ncbi:phospholipase D gamma 1 [Lactuca sativa]|uniref:Phospholipase D alpha 1 n=1 Tax=Lactuca sativa TaxID=4236 RepID=A0A9R1UYV1_LACSA|nr:phospholipase D gamma 1 [Lactuca sativa]KAJ0195270.1 hypothetical protein LSAT_V11C700345270 [Lactuca sativa]
MENNNNQYLYDPNFAPFPSTFNQPPYPPQNSAPYPPYPYPYPYQSQPPPPVGAPPPVYPPQPYPYQYPGYPYPFPTPSPTLETQLNNQESGGSGSTAAANHPHEDDNNLINQNPYENEPPLNHPGHHHSASYPSAGAPNLTGSLDSSSSQCLAIQQTASLDLASNQNYQIVPFAATPKKALKVLLLHGNLDILVHEAKNLPNMDVFHKAMGTSDPYVSIAITSAVVGRTYVLTNVENPIWNQRFNVPVAHHTAEIHFLVKDKDVMGSQLIGAVAIAVEHIYSGSKIEGFFPLINANGRPCKNGAGLALTMQYFPMARLSFYNFGVGVGPQYMGVPGTYFPLRRGGRVTLYQDAHVPNTTLPDIKLSEDVHYVHGTCWMDIFDAITNAQRLVYITGWSVWHKVRLVREEEEESPPTPLGDLLKAKAQEGVRVLLLVWDDPTSRNIMGYQTDGLMATHDEETRRFFKHSSVQVLLCPRMAGKKHGWMKKKKVGTIYTHHQKTVIVDTDAGNGKRRIISFIGGLDLCNGRYDTPQHPIFRTLTTLHSDDYHNPTFTGSVTGCPREPWHDLHSKIDGPAAYDIMTNFEERWIKASKPRGIKKLKATSDALLKLEKFPEILGANDEPCLSDEDPEGWHVQIFRSIDSNSVKGFPKDPHVATAKNLVCGKNVMIDMSIHSAYIKAIRSAQHFIYIENQYFIGSSYNWKSYRELGANNLIPMEIALKVASKIRAQERFAVYIVIPMWPEGVPTGSATQRILFWQNKTMQMMYQIIYKALVEVGLEEAFSPQDYLNFFCLGNREALSPTDSSHSHSPDNTPQGLARKGRRFMIYVHSKGMIVDDEFVLIGSANINQRSMEGTRDTEIAMGAYQPHHTWAKNLTDPRGQVHGYRMSLWAEHLGTVRECFEKPESIECVRQVRSMAEANWKQFAGDEICEINGHLMKYPVEVVRSGKVKSLPGFENFPDVGGQIIGSFLGIQENLTI